MLFECDLKEAVNLVRVSCVSTGGAATAAVNLLALFLLVLCQIWTLKNQESTHLTQCLSNNLTLDYQAVALRNFPTLH